MREEERSTRWHKLQISGCRWQKGGEFKEVVHKGGGSRWVRDLGLI